MNTNIFGLVLNKSDKATGKMGQFYDPDNKRELSLRDDSTFQFIDFWPKWSDELPEPHIRAWEPSKDGVWHCLKQKLIPIILISQPELTRLGIWDAIPETWQKVVISEEERIAKGENLSKLETINHMEKMRAARKSRYSDIPENITCIQCSKQVKVNKSLVAKKLDKQIISIDTYIKEFKCSTCNPMRRGKKANPEYAKIPKELTCSKCKNKVKTAPSNIAARAKIKGIPVEQFLNEFLCQTCHPTKGRTKVDKGNDFPTETICKGCKKVVKIVKANIEEKAKILGMTPMDLVNNYKCRGCGGKITKAQKLAAKKAEKKSKKLERV